MRSGKEYPCTESRKTNNGIYNIRLDSEGHRNPLAFFLAVPEKKGKKQAH